MRRFLPLIALLAAGCGAGATSSDSASAPAAMSPPAATNAPAGTAPTPPSAVDSTKPYSVRGDK